MKRVTRGFHRPRGAAPGRTLPPGQYDTGFLWPVLTAEPTPTIPADEWTFGIDGLVRRPTTWSWAEMHDLPQSSFHGDIHCVTAWSKFDMTFTGVALDVVLELVGVRPEATHALAFSHTGYTTNVSMADLTGGRAWIVWEADGQLLTAEHGGPARLLVPHLYFWKSAKWIAGLQLLDHEELGFWERNDYHAHGDPWLEERYEGD